MSLSRIHKNKVSWSQQLLLLFRCQVNCVWILGQCFGICGWAVWAAMVVFDLLWDEKKTIILQKTVRNQIIQMCCQHMLQIPYFGTMDSTNVVSPMLGPFTFDSSYTQIMIYATKLLLRNCKQWNFRLWLQDHSSLMLSQFVMSVQSYLEWQETFTGKNKVHIMMKNCVGKSH